jgi:hypothetical protein
MHNIEVKVDTAEINIIDLKCQHVPIIIKLH